MMKTSSRWMITLLACVVLIAGLAAYKYLQIQALIAYGKSFPEPSESVQAVTATVSRYQQSVTTIGVIIEPQVVELRNEEEGVIRMINFSSGSRVNKGDVLLQLDISEETARLKAAEARVNLSRLALDRAKRLIKQKGVSEETVDQAQANYAIAQADVMALQAVIDKKTLRAPFDATAGIHSLEVGQYLQANTAIVTLVGINDYCWVDFHLPLQQADIEVGSQVRVELPGQRDAVPAMVIAKEAMASASSRNIQLRAKIDSPAPVPHNTVVRVRIPRGEGEQILIPRVAVLHDSLGDYVYLLEKDEAGNYRAKRRAVTVGHQDEKFAGIVDGLVEGERVAADGAFKLYPHVLTHDRERPGGDSERSSGDRQVSNTGRSGE